MVERWGEEKISEIFVALRETSDIDAALLRVYGLDQYGMDSAWRQSLGLEALPPPEELERRLESPYAEETTQDTEGNGSAASEPEPSPPETDDPTESDAADPESESRVQPVSTEAPTEDPAGTSSNEDSEGSSSPCSAPPEGAASLGLGTLALMVTPLSLAGIPFVRRWRRRD